MEKERVACETSEWEIRVKPTGLFSRAGADGKGTCQSSDLSRGLKMQHTLGGGGGIRKDRRKKKTSQGSHFTLEKGGGGS